jgi:hypothetical protein
LSKVNKGGDLSANCSDHDKVDNIVGLESEDDVVDHDGVVEQEHVNGVVEQEHVDGFVETKKGNNDTNEILKFLEQMK